MRDSFVHLFIYSLVRLFRRRNLDLKSSGLKSSKYRFCLNIKVSDTGVLWVPTGRLLLMLTVIVKYKKRM